MFYKVNLSIIDRFLDKYIDEKWLFEETIASCTFALKNWVKDNPEDFIKTFNTDFDTVLNNYKFKQAVFSIKKSYYYDPSLYYITNTIRIYDEQGNSVVDYVLFFDDKLEIFDDTFKECSEII